jgi:hypothetical protein
MLGDGECGLMTWKWQWQCCVFDEVRQWGGVWAKNAKPNIHGLVSSMLCGVILEGGGYGLMIWWQCRGCTFANAGLGDGG